MITRRFERLFGRLVDAFKRYQEAPRAPDNVPDLGAARWNLELARLAIAGERERMAARAAAGEEIPRQTAISDADLARLRAFGAGYIGG